MKKHQAFEAEVIANEGAINKMSETGEAMAGVEHYASDLIRAKIAALAAQWQFLQNKSAEKAQKLKETQQFVKFRLESDEVESWISDKIAIASADDVGKDLEHVEVLEKKFEDFNNDVHANETRVDAINESALALISLGHPDVDAIKIRQRV
jgi:spectrin alpha